MFKPFREVLILNTGDKHAKGSTLGNLGNAYLVLGETRKAIEYYEQALIIDREIGDQRKEGNELWNTSLAFDKLDERQKAITYAKAALKILVTTESPYIERVRHQLDEWQSST